MSLRSYTFGPFRVDPGRRLVSKDGAPLVLSPRAFDVLLVLLQHHGSVVEKDDLIREVWRGAAVDENNIPRTISTLRKALEDGQGPNRWIVTIPGRGYQFAAEVVELKTDDQAVEVPPGPPVQPVPVQPTPPTAPTAAPVSSRPARVVPIWGLVAAALIAIAAAGSVVFLTLNSEPDSSAISQPRNSEQIWQLTFSSGLDGEPTWSPDGRLVAFSSNRSGNLDIWVQSIDGGNPVQITNSPAHDWQPDWSSDGRIVFRSEREGGGLYVVPALGGMERRVAAFGYHPRWSPDGRQILFQRSNFQGRVLTSRELYVVAPDGREPRQVLSSAIKDFTSFAVAWHPDSQRVSIWGVRLNESISFVTAPIDGGTPITSAMDDEVRTQVFGTNVRFTNPDNVPLPFLWGPAADALYFEGISRGVRNLWKVPVEPATLRWSGPPVRLTTSADLNAGLSLSRDGRKLAFAVRNERIRLWSYRVTPGSGLLVDGGEPITPDAYDALSPVLSQDGTRLAYETERGGNQEIHIRSAADGAERVLVGGDGYRRVSPVWSDDDTRIAYVRNRLNGDEAASAAEVVSISANGGPEQVVPTPVAFAQVFDWSATGKWFLGSLRPRRGAPFELVLATARNTGGYDVRVLATDTVSNLWKARLSPNRQWVAFTGVITPGTAGIVVVSAEGGQRIPVTTGESFDDRARWSHDGRLIYFLSNRSGFLNLWARRFDPDRGVPIGEPFALTHFDSPMTMVPPRMVQMGIAIAADRVILPISQASGNIWILDGLVR